MSTTPGRGGRPAAAAGFVNTFLSGRILLTVGVRMNRGVTTFAAAALLLLAGRAGAVVGDWRTDPDEALAIAAKAGKPILAVAMDHG